MRTGRTKCDGPLLEASLADLKGTDVDAGAAATTPAAHASAEVAVPAAEAPVSAAAPTQLPSAHALPAPTPSAPTPSAPTAPPSATTTTSIMGTRFDYPRVTFVCTKIERSGMSVSGRQNRWPCDRDRPDNADSGKDVAAGNAEVPVSAHE